MENKDNAENREGKVEEEDSKESERDDTWDCAEETADEFVGDSSKIWEVLTKLLVLFCSFLLFIVVLSSASITRAIVHLMMWNLNPPSINKTSNLGTLGGTIQPVESMIFLVHNCSIGKNNSNSATSCENGYRLRSEFPLWECPLENENRCRLWEVIPTVNVSWIWGLVIVMIAPAVYTAYVSSRNTLTGEVLLQSRSYIPYGCSSKDPILLALIAIGLGFLCFKSSRYACRTLLQRICFAPPLFLSLILVPLLLLAILSNPLFWTTKGCNIAQPIWQLNTGEPTEETVPLIVSSIMGLVSTILLTLYVWTNKGTKTTFSERMFFKPFYSGIFLDLSLLLSRRRSFEKEVKSKFSASSEMDDRIQFHPVVFFCATMWHETEEEMTQLLKSIFRTDYRYFILETTRKTEDIFSFDVHIFFDDAFKPRKNGKKGIHVNEYVKQLEKLIPMTAKAIYDGCELQPVEKYKTPYGARYEWELLSKQKLVVHLKDSTKIRHKKRWSQVMYMYYLLSYKTNEMRKEMENDPKLQSKGPSERKDVLKSRMQKYTNNIYILALDGDVDFKPEAIDLLLDRMKKNPLVGAACGRIHPIGSGPMIWYQKFEYAISHWLQKATEHIIGCVLCSPGCFSLFRGSAILSDNVIKTYTRTSSEALHYIQRDQGEDRWLCTLLLKQGFRVEYCAASDALTFAPEGFFEFYKQRRRWTPSTMANIFDLLLDWRKVRKTNRNISIFYVCYQVILFVFSILTPGTIFMLILGTIITAFPSIEPWLALVLNLMPVTIFILSIYLTKEETQLILAGVLSTIYSMVMLIVFIGLIKEGIESQFCSITSVFLSFVGSVFVIAAIFHPKEFDCLFYGLLYFLAVPSMSMLLILYSIGNMHNINWGTRESNIATERTLTDEIKSKFEGQSCNIGDWCRCIICAREIKEPNILENNENAENTEDMQSGHDTSIHVNIQNHIEDRGSENAVGMTNQDKLVEDFTNVLATSTAVKKTSQKDKGSKGIFKKCKPITPKEEKFWTDIIKKYLKPLKANKDKKKVQADLKDLRNKVFFFYFVINTAFVTLIFALTQINAYQGTLLIPLPCDTGDNQSTIEPISIACIVVFGILLTIQFFGMIYHRISTVTQIIATTTISEEKKSHPIVKIPSIEISEGILKEDTAQSPKKRKWVKVKAGMALKVLSGEKIKRPLTVDKLSESIRNQMPPSNNELKEMFKKFQNIPLIQSIRNTGHVYEDQTGPSSS
ncbi:chitin synthase chs-2-like [Saccostrea echinata]|uniref:chitin synthase chs-2-like n=1 Tax=Saccostrea echinata TaxID=191078 RepID=UPI002A7FF86F|nr:chitin synthase chs-2-like [Saccostrea echinata]